MKSYLKQILMLVLILHVENNLADGNGTGVRNRKVDEPVRFMNRVKFHGYNAEEHIVQSDDGYNLVLHRISGSPANPPKADKKVVYVQHGLLMSTDMFVTNGPGIDFVYLLVDAGYDVWLGNLRGNVYCQSHKDLLSADKEFWNFSYHEAAVYDVKAHIDYVLKVTKQNKCVYIGYSLGTTYGFALFSSRPEYNDKVSLIINLGTVITWHHNNNLIVKMLRVLMKYFEKLNGALKIYEFDIQLKHVGPLTADLCESKYFFVKMICKIVMKILIPKMRVDLVPEGSLRRMLSIFPAGTSTKTSFHLSQNMRSGNFAQYDYGSKGNQETYGTENPPDYPLEKITAPVAIYYGLKDIFSKPEDLDEMQKQLPNVILFKEIPDKDFGHYDIVLGKNARKVLFDDFINLINSVNQ